MGRYFRGQGDASGLLLLGSGSCRDRPDQKRDCEFVTEIKNSLGTKKYDGNTMEIRLKHDGNRPSKLGEIVNPAAISTYFKERSGVYFHCISR